MLQMTHDTWHMTYDMWHMACDMLWGRGGVWTFSRNFSILALTVCDLWYFWSFWGNGWLTEWMNDKTVCRTAPATPCLLIIKNVVNVSGYTLTRNCLTFFFSYFHFSGPPGQTKSWEIAITVPYKTSFSLKLPHNSIVSPVIPCPFQNSIFT